MDSDTISGIFLALALIWVPLSIWIIVRFIRLTKDVREMKEILMLAYNIEPYENVATWGKDGKQLSPYSKGYRKTDAKQTDQRLEVR